MINQINSVLEWVRKADVWAILTLFISSLLFFYDLFGARYLLTERDLAPYFIPPRFFWVESLRQFDFPLWNPYQFSGHPFFANPQNAALYPFNGLFFLFPFDIAFNSVILLHFFLAGLFTYLFMKDLRVSSIGSLISGLIWMLGGYLLSVHSLLTILLSVVWTPMVMLFFRRALIRTGIRNEMMTAIFITLSFLGGGIEIVYGNFFVLLIMAIFKKEKFEGSWSGWANFLLRRFKSFLITSIVFLFFSAIQLIPFLELWMHSIRGTGISYQEATVWSFAPKDGLLFFLPDAYGYFLDMKKYWITQCWLKTMYTGGLPFVLSLIFFIIPYPNQNIVAAGFSLRKNRTLKGAATNFIDKVMNGTGINRLFFLVLMVFSLFLSLGQYNPLYPFVFKYVPFFNGIRYPVKFLYIFILALAISAGLGFEKLVQFSTGLQKNTDLPSLPRKRESREKANWIPASAGMTIQMLKRLFQQPAQKSDGKWLKHLFMAFSLLSGFALLLLALGHGQIEHFLKAREIDFPEFNRLSVNLFHAKRFFFYLTLFFLLLRVGYELRWNVWAKVILVFFLITDLFGNMGFYGKEKSEYYFRKTEILENVTSVKEPFRAFSTGKTIALDSPILIGNAAPFDLIKEKHLPSLNMIFQVHDIWGVDVVRLRKNDELYKKFISLPSISSSRFVDVYGIKHVISITQIEEDPRFELIYARLEGLEGEKEELLKKETIKLYRVKDPSQRAQIVKNFRVMDSKEILSAMVGKDFQPNREVFLEEEPRWSKIDTAHPSYINEKEKKSVKFVSETSNRLTLQVQTDEDSMLVLSDTHYPGWKVFVNGREEKILRSNYHFRAVTLNRGSSRVEFIYDPLSLKLGCSMTSLGVMGFLVGWVIKRRKRSERSDGC